MGWIDKWNRIAKKRIYINESLEVPIGRLVYVSIITGIQILSLILMGAPLPSLAVLFSNFIMALKRKI